MIVFWLGLAGALGVLSRYGLSIALQRWLGDGGSRSFIAGWFGADFPIGTLVINVTGAFVLSLLTTLALGQAIHPNLRLILGTGFCGGYTTFSTFELEANSLLERGQWLPATAYIGGNLILGFIAVLLGRALAGRILGSMTL